MALPQGIFESFQENPGTDLDDTSGLSVLDNLSSNPMMAKILAKNKKIMQTEAFADPEPNRSVEKEKSDPYGGYGGEGLITPKPPRRQPTNEDFYNEKDEREIPEPSMEELLLKIKDAGKKLNEQKPVTQQYAQQTTYPQQTVGIDYTLLNTMVKAAVMEAMSTMKGSLLTESKNNPKEAVYMTIGNSIKFVDKKGNVYEGKLKLIGNAND